MLIDFFSILARLRVGTDQVYCHSSIVYYRLEEIIIKILYGVKNIEIVKYCQEYFGFALPSVLWSKRVSKFESSFKCFLSDL